ncbi:MAG: alpha/beta hydrolase [Desulfobacterales bacterium]|nr:alpha/beta hydrolase [Desulfobacterales bacterium]
METADFIRNKDYKIFSVLHKAESNKQSQNNNLGIVICHPFAEEKLNAHRVLVRFARNLASKGISCLRFDYMGHGDSEGNFEDATTQTRIADIYCAIDYLKKQAGIERVGLLGIRFGATLAALSCESNSEINPLILISPVIEGKTYIKQCLRSNIATQTVLFKKVIKDRKQLIDDLMTGRMVNIDGYLLTKKMYEAIEEINLLGTSISLRQILLIQVSKSARQPLDKMSEKLYGHYKENNKVTLLNISEDFFWTDTKIYSPDKKKLQVAIDNFLHDIC